MDYKRIATRQPDADAAEQQIRQRTIEELVDPYRDLPTLTLEDLRPDDEQAAPRSPFGEQRERPSFLDQWLARRRAADKPRPGSRTRRP